MSTLGPPPIPSPIPTPGQLRIRAIAASFVPQFDPTELWDSAAGIHLASQVQAALAADPITNQQLGRSIGLSYVFRQYAKYGHTAVRYPKQVVRVSSARFGYLRGSNWSGSAWAGGEKPHTVHNAVVALAAGHPIGDDEPEAVYLAGDDIWDVASGGNHRQLAGWLWGGGQVTAQVTVYQTVNDPDLEHYLADLESFLDSFDRRGIVISGLLDPDVTVPAPVHRTLLW